MYVYVLLYLGQLSHFLSCFGTGVTNLNEPPSSFLLPPPFWGHCEQQAMRDEGVIYVAGHPLLNRRCTRLPLPGCIRLRNDLYCVEWGVKLYSLTHPSEAPAHFGHSRSKSMSNGGHKSFTTYTGIIWAFCSLYNT